MADPATGANRIQAERYADLITLAEWGEELGFETFHVGEHHFCDYIVSNPVPLLTAAAMRTKRIKLSTAVTLLANRDPVLVAEDYAALDLISNGRAELVVGRGNFFVECYRQMGQDFAKSRAAFEENLDLLLRAWTDERISSSGATRPPLDNARIQPKPLQRPYPLVWIGGGSSEEFRPQRRLARPTVAAARRVRGRRLLPQTRRYLPQQLQTRTARPLRATHRLHRPLPRWPKRRRRTPRLVALPRRLLPLGQRHRSRRRRPARAHTVARTQRPRPRSPHSTLRLARRSLQPHRPLARHTRRPRHATRQIRRRRPTDAEGAREVSTSSPAK